MLFRSLRKGKQAKQQTRASLCRLSALRTRTAKHTPTPSHRVHWERATTHEGRQQPVQCDLSYRPRDRMSTGAHWALAALACTPLADRMTPRAMQQFHLRYMGVYNNRWVAVWLRCACVSSTVKNCRYSQYTAKRAGCWLRGVQIDGATFVSHTDTIPTTRAWRTKPKLQPLISRGLIPRDPSPTKTNQKV